jgi:hypothetical protein
MSAEVIYSVFVSSTFDDLREERGELQKALLKSKCFPIGMELFPSSDDDTWDFIKRQIDQANYYIVVIAGRYGSVGADGLSYTEMEYDYARSLNKPILSFIHGAPGKIPAERSEQDPPARDRLEAFKRKARRSIVNTYTTPHELAMQVMASLVDLKDRKPAIGFIRADQTVDARRYADLLEENYALKEMIGKLQPSMTIFDGANENISFEAAIFNRHANGSEINESRKTVTSTQSIGNIFIMVAESIIDARCNDFEISFAILGKLQKRNPEYKYKQREFINPVTFIDIRRKLFGSRLVELHPTRDSYETYNQWSLTEFGQAQYGLLTRGAGES